MASFKDNNNNGHDDDEAEKVTGSGSQPKPEETKPDEAAPTGEGEDANKKPAETAAPVPPKNKTKENIKGALSIAWKLAVFGPPALFAVIALGDMLGVQRERAMPPLQALSKGWESTKTVWGYEVGIPVGAAKFIAKTGEDYVLPVASNILTFFGMSNPAGPQAEVALYCPPKTRNTGVTPEQATQIFADQNYLMGAAHAMTQFKGGDIQRIIAKGGYPVIIGEFSNRANGIDRPNLIIQNAPDASNQVCPQGDFGIPWPIQVIK